MRSDSIKDFLDSVYAAINRDIPNIVYQSADPRAWREAQKKDPKARLDDFKARAERRPVERDVSIAGAFSQTWGSTALGFGGMGGASMTTALTLVIECGRIHYVYFGGRLAYSVPVAGSVFWSDCGARNLQDCSGAPERYGAIIPSKSP